MSHIVNSREREQYVNAFTNHGLDERNKDEIKERIAIVRNEKIRRGERKGLDRKILDLILSLPD